MADIKNEDGLFAGKGNEIGGTKYSQALSGVFL